MWQSFVLVGILIIVFFMIKSRLAGSAKKKEPQKKAQPQAQKATQPQTQKAAQPQTQQEPSPQYKTTLEEYLDSVGIETEEKRQVKASLAEAARKNAIILSAKDGLGELILKSLDKRMDKDLLEVLELIDETEPIWQAAFILWLMHYIGRGTAPDSVENKDILKYLDSGLFRKAHDIAPKTIQKLLEKIEPYVGSGVNCTSMHSDDTAAKVRMRGLFHAVVSADFVDNSTFPADFKDLSSETLLYGTVADEAAFWTVLFSGFPGVDNTDPELLFITKYFAAINMEEYAVKVRQECLAAVDRSARKEPEQPGDDLRLLIVNLGKSPSCKGNPCRDLLSDRSDSEKMLPLINGAFMGNAACMYSMALMTIAPKVRQDMDAFLRDHYQQDLVWGINRLKQLLDAQTMKGDPFAELAKGNIRGNN